MNQHGSRAYLVNTGWSGGSYGVGKRMDLKITRAIITAILDGTLEKTDCETLPIFDLRVPKTIPGVDGNILNPCNTWKDPAAYDATAKKLAGMFIEAFRTFTDTPEGKRLEQFGPKL